MFWREVWKYCFHSVVERSLFIWKYYFLCVVEGSLFGNIVFVSVYLEILFTLCCGEKSVYLEVLFSLCWGEKSVWKYCFHVYLFGNIVYTLLWREV